MQNVTDNTLVLCLWRLWLWPVAVLTRSARQPHIALVLTYRHRHRTLSRPTHGRAFRLYWTTKTKSMSMSMPMTKPNEKAKPRPRARPSPRAKPKAASQAQG